jgi:Concanavalin A-like lectin/glucanases superfamily
MARSGWSTSIYLNKSSVALVTATPLTMALWYNPSSLAADAILLAITAANDNNIFDLQVPTASKNGGAETGGSAAWSIALDGGAALTTGTWVHLAAVFDTGTTSRTAYRNGVAGTTNTGDRTPLTLSQSWIGIQKPTGNPATGTIAFPGFWNVKLTDPEIKSLAAGRHPRRVRPGACIGALNLTGAIVSAKEVDLVAASWPVTGSPTEVANPRIYF